MNTHDFYTEHAHLVDALRDVHSPRAYQMLQLALEHKDDPSPNRWATAIVRDAFFAYHRSPLVSDVEFVRLMLIKPSATLSIDKVTELAAAFRAAVQIHPLGSAVPNRIIDELENP